jgi:hypothetical protein
MNDGLPTHTISYVPLQSPPVVSHTNRLPTNGSGTCGAPNSIVEYVRWLTKADLSPMFPSFIRSSMHYGHGTRAIMRGYCCGDRVCWP